MLFCWQQEAAISSWYDPTRTTHWNGVPVCSINPYMWPAGTVYQSTQYQSVDLDFRWGYLQPLQSLLRQSSDCSARNQCYCCHSTFVSSKVSRSESVGLTRMPGLALTRTFQLTNRDLLFYLIWPWDDLGEHYPLHLDPSWHQGLGWHRSDHGHQPMCHEAIQDWFSQHSGVLLGSHPGVVGHHWGKSPVTGYQKHQNSGTPDQRLVLY